MELPFDVLKFSEETEAERAVAAVEQNAARYARWGGEPQRIAIDRKVAHNIHIALNARGE